MNLNDLHFRDKLLVAGWLEEIYSAATCGLDWEDKRYIQSRYVLGAIADLREAAAKEEAEFEKEQREDVAECEIPRTLEQGGKESRDGQSSTLPPGGGRNKPGYWYYDLFFQLHPEAKYIQRETGWVYRDGTTYEDVLADQIEDKN